MAFVVCLFYEQFLILKYYKMVQAHPVYFLPRPRISHSSKKPWILLLKNTIRKKDLDTRYMPAGASLVTQMVKNPAALQEAQVQSLAWEDLLEKGTATHPVSLPREFCGQRNLAGYSPWGCKALDMTGCLTQHCSPTKFGWIQIQLNF